MTPTPDRRGHDRPGTAPFLAVAMTAPAVSLQFHRDPISFLTAAEDFLALDPVVNTVVASIAHRAVAQLADGIAQPDRNWWMLVRDRSGAVCGAGMRTSPFVPYPVFLLPMPDEAAVCVARTLHDRGEEVLRIRGALPAARLCAAEFALLYHGRVDMGEHLRLHALTDVIPPAPVAGGLVAATEADLDLVMRWLADFSADADEQAGRARGATRDETPRQDEIVRRIRAGLVWFWTNGTGQPVHMTAAAPPSYGVVRIGPVYTPPDQRGNGWASNAVARISAHLQSTGAKVCLFTDQANPASNKLYASLGYRPVTDVADFVIVRGVAGA